MVITVALAAGGLALAAGVANAHDSHSHGSHSHGSHSHSSDGDSGSDVQGTGGPESAASDFRPAGVPVVSSAKAVTAATSALPDGSTGSGD